MKKLIVPGLVMLILLNLGCGTNSSQEKTAPKGKAAEAKKTVLDTKDAMMAKLTEYNITIPDGMVFRSVDKQVYLNKDFEETDTYLVYFDITYENGAKKDELLTWYNAQREILKNNGWTEKSYKKDVEILGGGSYDMSILVKESENCTLDMRVSFTDVGSTISIHPKYEIK